MPFTAATATCNASSSAFLGMARPRRAGLYGIGLMRLRIPSTLLLRYPTNPLGLFLIIPPERQRGYWAKGQGDFSERAKLGLIANANPFGTGLDPGVRLERLAAAMVTAEGDWSSRKTLGLT